MIADRGDLRAVHITHQCIKSKAEVERKYRWIFVDKKVNIKLMKVSAEIVNGECPTCERITLC